MARQGDAVENLDHRAVIFPTESGITGGGEHIQRGGSERQRKVSGSVIHQPEIFDKNIDSGFWRVIAIQDVLHAILKHPGITRRVGDHVIHRLQWDPGAGGKRIASAATAMCTGQQLMDNFTVEPRPMSLPMR